MSSFKWANDSPCVVSEAKRKAGLELFKDKILPAVNKSEDIISDLFTGKRKRLDQKPAKKAKMSPIPAPTNQDDDIEWSDCDEHELSRAADLAFEELNMEPSSSTAIPRHPGNQPDEYVQCPYFPEHELRKSRLPYHLIKCQKNPSAPKLVACPFNYLHRVKPEDRQEHIIRCEDKLMTKYADKDPPSYAKTCKEYTKLHGGDERPTEEQDGYGKTEDDEESWD